MDRAEAGFSGRESELYRVGRLLDVAASGTGGVVMIQGVPGIGKTALLQKIADIGVERGCTIMEFSDIGAPDARHSSVTFSVRSTVSSITIEALGARQLQRHIEAQTVHGPVLIAGDDLHRAKECERRSMLSLVRRLAEWPVIWALATRTVPAMAEFMGRLTTSGWPLCLLELEGLPDQAVYALVGRLVGGEPGPELLELAASADGNPLLVTTLVTGLLSEQVLEVKDGLTRLRSSELPGALVRAVQRRVDELSGRCRQFVTVATTLGELFALDEVADVLGELPARLLPELDEAVRAGILVSGGRSIRFASELLRRTLSETTPQSVVSAAFAAEVRPPAPIPAQVRPPGDQWRGERAFELNEVERQIVRMVGSGLTNDQIAHRLVKSKHTVNYHLQKLYRRLNVHSRAELIGLLQRPTG